MKISAWKLNRLSNQNGKLLLTSINILIPVKNLFDNAIILAKFDDGCS